MAIRIFSPARDTAEALARKVRLATWALALERLWPRLWMIAALVILFVLVSLAGVWTSVSDRLHQTGLGIFALAFLAAIVWAARTPWPTRDEALRRLETRTGAPHRPATSYEDTLTAPGDDPVTSALWRAHRERLSRQIARLKIGRPEPRTDRHDPIAVRALLVLVAIVGLALAGESARDRLTSAFRWGPGAAEAVAARLDAWVTPPAYTARPPIMLADGAGAGALKPTNGGPVERKPLLVPVKSLLIARTSGAGANAFALEVRPAGGAPVRIDAKPTGNGADGAEARVELVKPGQVAIIAGGRDVARWDFDIIPDLPPSIALTKDPEASPRGSLKLTYTMADDYGLASAEARFERVDDDGGDPATRWAREDVLKGPRPPHERPPVLALRLPRPGTKEMPGKDSAEKLSDITSRHELASHPWAGFRARMTLVARDHAGNAGRSETVEIVIPERKFRNPVARAVVEQRRLLIADPRVRPLVLKALDALTMEPEGFISDRVAYLQLRSAYHRLIRAETRADRRSVIDQLWHAALRLEDGRGLSDAERRLRELQDQLSKAIEDGASDQEIQRLMQELRQALAEFMEQMARQAQDMPPMDMQGMNPNQVVRPEDLDRMLRNIEQMARQGSREQAQDMLSQLRDLLDQLQSGRMANMPGQMQQQNQMNQLLNQFGDIIGRQRQLMDETFGEQRQRDGQQGQGQQGQRGQRGQQGQQGQGQQGQGQQGQGQQGQGQQGQGQQGQGRQPGGRGGELGERQGQLGDMLGQLQRGLRDRGLQAPGQLDGARESMERAEEALRQGDYQGAMREQAQALEQLRQGAQSLAQQMQQQQPSQYGQGPAGDAPRDPLGRAMNDRANDSGAPDASYKVPGRGEIDAQRARDILEELRRRLGEPTRPMIELDYLERLLRRF